MFYLPLFFFYYLAKLIIFTRSSRISCIFFLKGIQGHLFKRKKFYPFIYGFRDSPRNSLQSDIFCSNLEYLSDECSLL